MTAYNVVRFRVKPGQEARFLDAHRDGKANWPGLLHGAMIKTGDQSYCLIGEWADAGAIVEARGKMIETLDSFRDTLESAETGHGVTDAVSGPVVLDLKSSSRGRICRSGVFPSGAAEGNTGSGSSRFH